MTDTSQNNKRIAKNTLLLYFRMFFIMAVSLYTSRVILKNLGVEDFGIYNVVGGIVAMMGVFNQSLAASIQRYLSYELGKGDIKQLKKVFCVSLTLYALLSIALIILAETIGLWFLNNKMIIPNDRIVAANWVYQFSILTCIITLITNVYNAVIISHERMSYYAYISILEVILKLIVVYMLQVIKSDKLVTYAILMFLVSLLICLCYIIYCRLKFIETKYKLYRDKTLFKELFTYSGWNLFGIISGMCKTQGLNILLNMFFTPAVNASRGIAVQVNGAVGQFFNNFFTAVRPQITMYYAKNDKENFIKLLFGSSKFSVYLILLVSLPILIEAPYIIQMWLGQLPEYVVSFTRLIILIGAVDAIANPLMTAAQATGHIKLYQSLVGTTIILNIPISYLFLKMGCNPNVVFIISLSISVLCLFLRIWVVNRLIPYFNINKYIVNVLAISVVVCVISSIIPILLTYILNENITSFIIISLSCVISTVLSCYGIGLTKNERTILNASIKKIYNKI